MQSLFQSLNRNPVFKFLSSVKLAVPLMLILGGVVAAGTLYESRYNAEYAGLLVYKTFWFEGLMFLLWINILFAALSRIPYKAHHTGFVITHIGLLTLLIGALITSRTGIDGQLRVLEGSSGNTVVLQELVLKVREPSGLIHETAFPRRTREMSASDLDSKVELSGTGITLEHYFPFTGTKKVPATAGGAAPGNEGSGKSVSFRLKSRFFDVKESLDTESKPSLQMGPATVRILTQEPHPSKAGSAPVKKGPRIIEIRSAKEGRLLKTVSLSELKAGPITINGTQVLLTRSLEDAVVAKNKLEENGKPGANPALELKVQSGGKSVREIVYARFAQFSLNPNGAFGLRFAYQAEGEGDAPNANTASSSNESTPGGNVIDFISRADGKTLIRLSKNGVEVLKKEARPGEPVVTPWMGMEITLESAGSSGTLVDQIVSIEPEPKSPLPPSAILIRGPGAEAKSIWLQEGSSVTLDGQRGQTEIYFGPRTVELPFQVHLKEFRKIDYPGTATALSFESTITLGDTGMPQVIQMNEPLQEQGYILYQSSYEQGPGIPTASIFSVNRDPGRMVKYMGALILIFGIVIFTLMRSRWYSSFMKRRSLMATLLLAIIASSPLASRASPEEDLNRTGSAIRTNGIEALPVQSRGRVKPLLSHARETVLFVTGKYGFFGLDPVQLYLTLPLAGVSNDAKFINVRDPGLRVKLGFRKEDRHLSIRDLEASPLQELVKPLIEKQEKNERSLSPDEKTVLEVQQQLFLAKDLVDGGNFKQALIFDSSNAGHGSSAPAVLSRAEEYLTSLKTGDSSGEVRSAIELEAAVRAQPMPDLFKKSLPKMNSEILYTRIRPFLWCGILYLLLGLSSLIGYSSMPRYFKAFSIATGVAILLHIGGFGSRVYITGFAPVTNMYGTMIWMSLGVSAFGLLLHFIYRNAKVLGLLFLGSGLTLLLTESIPLILSPDLDPIVAVLRNNFWLSTHVLTVSISYAAFSIAMIIGNAGLILRIAGRLDLTVQKQFAHITYRAIQLGVFLLTAGIILGGWWADYSWGRFWGWDPKETWALIADLGFLAILHARYVGWLKDFGILAMAPVSYLLVIMAWYGVNFILAAGLHSYGFSSGGATIVVTFVSIQLALLATAITVHRKRSHS